MILRQLVQIHTPIPHGITIADHNVEFSLLTPPPLSALPSWGHHNKESGIQKRWYALGMLMSPHVFDVYIAIHCFN